MLNFVLMENVYDVLCETINSKEAMKLCENFEKDIRTRTFQYTIIIFKVSDQKELLNDHNQLKDIILKESKNINTLIEWEFDEEDRNIRINGILIKAHDISNYIKKFLAHKEESDKLFDANKDVTKEINKFASSAVSVLLQKELLNTIKEAQKLGYSIDKNHIKDNL